MKQSQITLIILSLLIIIGVVVFAIKNKKESTVIEDQTQITNTIPAAKMSSESLTAKKNAIQGTWQSVLDVKSQLQLTGDQKIDIYDSKTVSTDSYVLNPEAGDAGFVLNATTKDGEAMEYTVTELTDTTLILSLKSGNGQTLSFTRIK